MFFETQYKLSLLWFSEEQIWVEANETAQYTGLFAPCPQHTHTHTFSNKPLFSSTELHCLFKLYQPLVTSQDASLYIPPASVFFYQILMMYNSGLPLEKFGVGQSVLGDVNFPNKLKKFRSSISWDKKGKKFKQPR